MTHHWTTCVLLFCMPAAALAQEAPPFASFEAASAQVLNDPHDLTFGPDGNLYIADKFGDRVVLMNPDTLEIVGSFGDGALRQARDVSFGPDGKLYVAATGLSALVIFDMSGGAPESDGALGPFPGTEGALAHSNGRLYVMSSATGQLLAVEGEDLVASADGFRGAHDVAEGPDGTVWVADNFRQRLVVFDEDLTQLRTLEGSAYGFRGPRYMDFDDAGALIVADQDAHRVLRIDPDTGEVLGIIGTGEPGMGAGLFDDPEGITSRGTEYFVSDSDNNRVVKYVVVVN